MTRKYDRYRSYFARIRENLREYPSYMKNGKK